MSALDIKMDYTKFNIANEAKRNEIVIGKRIMKLWSSKSFFSLHRYYYFYTSAGNVINVIIILIINFFGNSFSFICYCFKIYCSFFFFLWTISLVSLEIVASSNRTFASSIFSLSSSVYSAIRLYPAFNGNLYQAKDACLKVPWYIR